MSNQTLAQIPLATTTDPARLRIFLLRLIEKLDIVLGYRGNDGYVSQSQLANTNQQINVADLTLLGLAQEIQRLFEITTTNTENISTNTENISTNTDNIDDIQQGTAVLDLSFSQVTASASYTQSEAQDVADQAKQAGDKIDELLAILRLSGIIS